MPQNSQTYGGRFSIRAMPHFTGNHSLSSNRHEQSFSQTISKNLRLSLESSSERCVELETQPLGLQLQDYRQPLSTLSSDHSLHEVTDTANKISDGLCLSSNSVQNGYYQKHIKEPTESDFVGNNLELSVKPSQWSQSTVPGALSQPSLFNALLNAYGPQALFHAQMAGMAVPSRIPLPCDVSQDTPVYVNIKQYFGILRRRRMRAKLHAQNKLMKTRKPYLHESRHRHAVNRVRTSGGQFLSSKKQQSNSTAATRSLVANQDREMLLQFHQDRDLLEIGIGHLPNGTNSSHTGHPNNYHLTFHQEDRKVPIESCLMDATTVETRVMMFDGTQNCTLGFL